MENQDSSVPAGPALTPRSASASAKPPGKRRRLWKILAVLAVVLAFIAIGLLFFANKLRRSFEPQLRALAIGYLEERFDSKVEIASLDLNLPKVPFAKLAVNKGRGVLAEVLGHGIVVRHRGRTDLPPMLQVERVRFDVDLGRLFDPQTHVALVRVEGMTIHIPPRGQRPSIAAAAAAPSEKTEDTPADQPENDLALATARRVFIQRVEIADSRLIILPKRKDRVPLTFELHQVALQSTQGSDSLHYVTKITNAKPPGMVDAEGQFGPWNAASPVDTPLSGNFTFRNADLGVFSAIAGTLTSQGNFHGLLGNLVAKGTAEIPNFRLKSANQPMPLYVEYETEVDGSNGDTILKPVRAKLNRTQFTTGGAVVKHDGDTHRTIDLDVTMPAGEMADLLRLAVKGPPMLTGRVKMAAKVRIPPLSGKVSQKLIVDGRLHLASGHFEKVGIQDKLDSLSRRAQGQPKNLAIDEVASDIHADFRLDGREIEFRSLQFFVPGSAVELAGQYHLDPATLDLHGTLRLQARASQTMTGWKRWALKPIDPLLAKNGAGVFLKIKVTGSSKDPKFSASR